MLSAAFVWFWGVICDWDRTALSTRRGWVFPCFGVRGTARPGGRDDASIVPYRLFAVFAAHGKVSPRRDEGIAPYRLVLLFVM